MTSVHVALAQAHKSTDTTQRLHNLKIVEAILLEQKQEVTLNNIESVLLFYTDSENSLQLFVLSFIEKLCSLYVEVACIPALQTLLKFYNTHPSPVLQKRAILTLCSIYKPIFQWISASAKVAAVHRKAWELLCVLRDRIVHLIPSSVPEAVRLSIYKYIQRVILVQTPVSFEVRDRGASQTEDNLNFNVSTLPYDHSLLSRADLVTEANSYVSLLINYLRNPVSATSLIVLTNLLSEIARKRPDYYLPRVLQSLIRLCQAFPAFQPYQLVSLKKQIKVHFMALRSVPLAKDFYSQISAIIESFGGNKAGKPLYLEPGAREKRLREESSERLRPKRTKPATTSGSSAQLLMRLDGLPHHVIVDLLLAHLARLPTSMPASFPQIMTVAQLYTISSATHKTERAFSNGVQTSNLKTHIDLNLKCVQNVEDSSGPAGPARVLEPATGADPKSKHTPFKVKPVPLKNCDKLAAFSRLLDSENDLFLSGARKIRRALLAKLAQVQQVFEKYKDPAHSDFNDFTVLLRDVLTKDIRKHQTLAVAWLYEEYTSAMHKRRFGDKEIPTALCAGSGFAIEEAPTNSFKVDINTTDLEGAAGQMSRGAPPQYLERYLACYDFIVKIVKGIVNNEHRETLFRRFLLEVPEVSIEAFKAIEEFCNDEYRAKFGFESLYELVLYRPRYRAYSLNTLLAFTIIEKKLIRSLSGQVCVRLCAIDGDIKAKICNFAMKCLRYLEREPPDDVQEERSADDSVEQPSAGDAISTDPSTQESADRPSKRWPLESVQAYSSLFFALCMETPEFLKSLLPVYAQVKSEVQRGFLQAVTPVVLNFHSDAIFQKLFQNAPENSYQLLLFMLEIYTKHEPPSEALVDCIQELYARQKYPADILIPVITKLPKKDILSALPKLVLLREKATLKWMSYLLERRYEGVAPPISPTDFLLAVHDISVTQLTRDGLRYVHSHCFEMRSVFTQEVLANVIQRLVDRSTLPNLLMPTIIKALLTWPSLSNFVVNVLRRMVSKSIWQYTSLYKSFVKTCFKMGQSGYNILLELPPRALESAFSLHSDYRRTLAAYLELHPTLNVPESTKKLVLETPKSIDVEVGFSHVLSLLMAFHAVRTRNKVRESFILSTATFATW